MRTKQAVVASLLYLGCAMTGSAYGATPDDYPSRPIKIVVPFAPGGGADFIARVTSGMLTDRFRQSVLVENKPGAASTIGSEYVIKSAPDGYTLLLISGSYTVTPNFYKLNYDPIKDIAPIIQLSEGGYMLAVHPDLPVKNLQELITLLRKQPGKIAYSSSGAGGHLQIITEYLLNETSTQALHVPYRGTGPAVAGLLSGDTQMMFGGPEQFMPQVNAGKLRIIAVTTAQRLKQYPDIPTIAESGVPGFEAGSWHGLAAPKGTPAPLVRRLNEALNTALQTQAVEEKLATHGISPKGGTPEAFLDRLKKEIATYANVIKQARITMEP